VMAEVLLHNEAAKTIKAALELFSVTESTLQDLFVLPA